MPLVGDLYGSKGTDLMANESGSDSGTMSKRIKDINEIPENEITLDQLLMNLATSGNQKHVQLASDLLELNLIQDNLGLNGSDKNERELTLDSNVKSDNLGSDCLDKISFSANRNSEHETTSDNNTETNMEWTTVRPKNKRVRSNSNDSEKIKLDITVSPSKKQKLTIQTSKLPEKEIIESKVKVNQTKILGQNQKLGLGKHSVKIEY